MSRDKEHMMESSAAMTKTMLDDAEVMHGLGPVPLLQRQSAVESRWTRTVPKSRERESARIKLSGTSVFVATRNGRSHYSPLSLIHI